jgi:thiol-disulfide isomerase/thioredoxin
LDLKKTLNKNNISNGIFVLLICTILFVPQAKAFVIQGLMEIGLFKPSVIETNEKLNNVPAISFKDVNGKVISLESLKGKVVFINFWATWCPPCLAEMPSINKLYKRFGKDDDVVFIMVDADSKLAKAKEYMDRKQYQMPIFEMASNVPEQLFTGSLPTTIVFDKHGRLSFKEEGAANYASQKFIDFIEKLKALKD